MLSPCPSHIRSCSRPFFYARSYRWHFALPGQREERAQTERTLSASLTWTSVRHYISNYELLRNKDTEESDRMFLGMLDSPSISRPSAYAKLLQQCVSLRNGRKIHDHVIKHGSDQNIYLQNCLGYFYGRFGALHEAHSLFLTMQSRDEFSWNFLIRAYAMEGRVAEALELFHQMQLDGVQPDRFSFISILSASDDIAEGMMLHTGVIEHMMESENLIANALVNFYGKRHNLEDAMNIFRMMIKRDIISWNSIIYAYAQHGELSMAFSLFTQMLHAGLKPDKVSFIALICVSSDKAALDEGQYVHMYVTESDNATESSVGNALVSMYGKCSAMIDARTTFEMMDKKDSISWNAIITACVHNEEGIEALQLHSFLLLKGWAPNKVTLVNILDACASEGLIMEGRRLHMHILCKNILSDVVLETAIVHMYGKCKRLQDAQIAFDHMPERNIFSWNTVIAAYAQCSQGTKAVSMYQRMLCESVPPNQITYVSLVSACVGQETLFRGKCVHSVITYTSFSHDVVIGTSLVHMYGKHGCLKDAWTLFEELPMTNLVSWNTIVAAYAQQGNIIVVRDLCNCMQQQGLVPDKVTFLSLLYAYASQGALALGKQTHACLVGSVYQSDIAVANALVTMFGEYRAWTEARNIFEHMHNWSVSSWNALIGAYVKSDQCIFAFQAFDNMHSQGVISDEVTFISILDACLSEMTAVKAQRLYVHFVESGLKLDAVLASAFINVYGKCGRRRDARRVFNAGPKDKLDAWNSMISVYAQSGNGKEALCLLAEMRKEGVAPNEVTFISVLIGCSHAGLIMEGLSCFNSMFQEHKIEPKIQHYNCIIDMLGRAGNLDGAASLMSEVPYPPTCTALLSLLAACRHQADVTLGEQISEIAFITDPEDSTPYIMMWNIYAIACNFQNYSP